MIHARSDYNRIQDPGLYDRHTIYGGSTPIAEDEPVFLVRAKDAAFEHTVRAWIAAHVFKGGDSAMCEALERHIELAQAWQEKNGCRVADAPEEALK